jgi:mono/diheme cytochrome c family protein
MTIRMPIKTSTTYSSAALLPVLLMCALWATFPGTALAQQEAIAAAGQREFRHSCAVCHGLGGKGESVMTAFNLLTVRPPDLTQLSKKTPGSIPVLAGVSDHRRS